VFLEGGYDLQAVRDSVAATLPALLEVTAAPPEAPTRGGPGADVVEAAHQRWAQRVD
jgi:acetoin utilization deacetylase AcuC-like enzyme